MCILAAFGNLVRALAALSRSRLAAVTFYVLPFPALAQIAVPPDALRQFQDAVGNRVEAVSILGGDYAAAGGLYSFRSGTLVDLAISKIGGSGEVASPRSLGIGDLKWAPVLQGNLGMVSAENQFTQGYLQGNRMNYDTLAVAAGGGAAIYLTDHLRVTPTFSGIYGRVENEFLAHNANGDYFESVANGILVNWTMDTWSVMPAVGLNYQWTWGRTTFELSSGYSFFHTESFQSSSDLLGVDGDSSTWQNKLDIDVPLGLTLFGRELHTGGFFARTDLFGGAAQGLDSDFFYTANGRLVLDFTGKLWKLKWVGLGVSYFWGGAFDGWCAGLDMRFGL